MKDSYFLGELDIEKVLVSKIYFAERNYQYLLVTCMIIIKLSLYK